MAWLDALACEDDIRVPGVRRTPAGETIVQVTTPQDGRTFPVTVVDWLPGNLIGAQKGTQHFEELGRMTAVLHRHARTWRLPAGLDRPTYEAHSVLRETVPARIAMAVGAVSGKVVNEALGLLGRQLQEAQEALGAGTESLVWSTATSVSAMSCLTGSGRHRSTSTTADSAATFTISPYHSLARSGSRGSAGDTTRFSRGIDGSCRCRVTCLFTCRSFSGCARRS